MPDGAGGGKSPEEKKKIPGWREIVGPFREEAYFWHQVWVSYGRPLNTETKLREANFLIHAYLVKSNQSENPSKSQLLVWMG